MPANDFIEFKKEETNQSIHQRFEKQVARYSNRTAVKSGIQELTYDGLNKKANRVAGAILKQCNELQEPVALLLQEGISLTAGVLGVLKSGNIYLPLDSLFPRARSEHILRDSQAKIIVTDNRNFAIAHELTQGNIQLINIDELDSGLSAENLDLAIKPDDLAWLIYTSGSTGQPKGVFKSHRRWLHDMMGDINELHISIYDRIASFGMSELSFWLAILNGATFYNLDIKENGLGALASWLIQEKITVCTFVVTAFRHFIDTLTGAEVFPELRVIRLSSEPMYRRDVELFKKHFSEDCVLVNQMGITESGCVCRYFMDRETQISGNYVPVGYPVPGKEVLILDENGDQLEPNRIGEIAVRSLYLANGYWRKPELTQTRFLPDPAGGDEYIYLTGDLGRILPDGQLIHLGRKDFQLKIRGHRIEAAEIEMALLNLHGIKEAVVMARKDGRGNQRLVAYLVLDEVSGFSVSQLRSGLAESLPEYMIPEIFVKIDAMPLTPSGKINRLALPEPDKTRPELEIPFVAPRSPIESTLAEIWSGVLELDSVGIHDNFLELGGNSLTANQIISRVTDKFQIKASINSLFRSLTIADMALEIIQNLSKESQGANIDQILAELEKLSDDKRQ